MACVNCGINIAPLEPRSFSFNSATVRAKVSGTGTVMEIDANKIVPDPSQPIGKVEFLAGVDKAGAAYLKTALGRDHRTGHRRRQARATGRFDRNKN